MVLLKSHIDNLVPFSVNAPWALMYHERWAIQRPSECLRLFSAGRFHGYINGGTSDCLFMEVRTPQVWSCLLTPWRQHICLIQAGSSCLGQQGWAVCANPCLSSRYRMFANASILLHLENDSLLKWTFLNSGGSWGLELAKEQQIIKKNKTIALIMTWPSNLDLIRLIRLDQVHKIY